MNRLLRSAYLSGARTVLVQSEGRRTRIEIPASVISPEKLSSLLEELFQNFGSAAYELASGANLAFGIENTQVEICIDDGVTARVMSRNGKGEVEIFRVESSGQASTVFQLYRSGAAVLSSFGANSKEYLSIVRRFRLTPLRVKVNRETLSRSLAWGKREIGVFSRERVKLRNGLFSLGEKVCRYHHVAELRIFSSQPDENGIGLEASTASSRAVVGSPTMSGGLETCTLSFGLKADTSLPTTVSWVYCGETLQTFPARLVLPGVDIAVSAHGLSLDASGEKLVQNRAFTNRWEYVKGYFTVFARALLKSYPNKRASKLVSSIHFDEERNWIKPFQTDTSSVENN